MTKKKCSFKDYMPKFQDGAFPMPPMPFVPWGANAKQNDRKEADSTKKENFKSTLKTLWTQNIDMQKSAAESGKEQWNKFFDYMMEMQDTFTGALPEDTSSLPFEKLILMPPKDFMKRVKDFQEMAKEHFVEQVDSFTDFCIKGQEQLYDLVTAAMDAKAKKDKEEKKEKEEAAEETKN